MKNIISWVILSAIAIAFISMIIDEPKILIEIAGVMFLCWAFDSAVKDKIKEYMQEKGVKN